MQQGQEPRREWKGDGSMHDANGPRTVFWYGLSCNSMCQPHAVTSRAV